MRGSVSSQSTKMKLQKIIPIQRVKPFILNLTKSRICSSTDTHMYTIVDQRPHIEEDRYTRMHKQYCLPATNL